MKKLFLALAILFPFLSFAQKPYKTIGTTGQIVYAKGGIRIDSFAIFPKINDTTTYHGDFIIRLGVPYVWNGSAYLHLRTDTLGALVQVPADWAAGSGVAQILNKPTFATVATTGAYADLTGKPSIPAQFAPVQGNGILISGSYPNITFRVDSAGVVVTKAFLSGQGFLTANQSITFTPGAGDVTGSASGTTSITPTLTIGNNKVTFAKLQQLPGGSVFGNPTGSTANSKATYIKYGLIFDADSVKVDTTTLKTVFGVGGGSPQPFIDNLSLVKNSIDATKQLIISAASVATATTRTLTAQNANYIIAGTNINNSFSVGQTFSVGPTITSFTSNGGPLYANGSGVMAQATAGGATQVLHGGTVPAFGAVVLSTDVSGVLGATNGGTAQTTFATGDILYASAPNTLAKRTIGTANQIFLSNGTAPTWVNASSIESLLTLSNMIGPLSIAKGGTNATTANGALTNLLPSMTGQSGKVLSNNGTVTSWIAAGGTGTVTSVAISGTDFGITGSPITAAGTIALNLATVNGNVGSFGDATHVGAFTVNAKGLITAASSIAVTYPNINLFAGSGLIALNDSTFEWNGPLTKNTLIAGAGFTLGLGSSGSKLASFSLYTSGAAGIALNGWVVNGLTTATDANFTIITTFSILPTITAGRNLVLPTSPVAGTELHLVNRNASGNAWTFTNGTVKNPAGTTVTVISNTSSLNLVFDGTNWNIY